MPLHRILSLLFAFSVGLMLALFAFKWISNPEPRLQRAREEAVVFSARDILKTYVGSDIEIVDPLAKNRAAGKAYIYPTGDGWEVSGHYRRDENERWHPFLMALDANAGLVMLSVRDADAALSAAAMNDPRFSVSR